MIDLKWKLEAWLEDVNQEDGSTLLLFETITDKLFFLIKWAGIPYLVYLLITVASK